VFKVDRVLENCIPVGDDRCRFDSEDLTKVIQDMVKKKLGTEGCLMSEIPPRPYPVARTFVVAKKALHADGPPTIFRSYKGDGIRPSKCAIWKAARATSAAPQYFKEMFVEVPAPGMSYVDGGLGHNNPSQVALDEARRIWPTIRHFGILSIGTGRQKGVEAVQGQSMEDVETQRFIFDKIRSVLPSVESIVPQWKTVKNFPPGVLAVIKMTHALTSLATDSENVHQQLQLSSHDQHAEKQFPYFRFNAGRDVGDIGLSDVEPLSRDRLAASAHNYLLECETETRRRRCVDFLVNPPCVQRKFRFVLSVTIDYQGIQSTRRILSLDGGGVRCFSSLIILDEIMKELARKKKCTGDARPCQHFDLICGSGFGGILAILLGQLGLV
jgi:predicted acylesterase/phospholipase RssA